jgi:uncharacterized repeat protein (TIGR01451 family)
MLPQGPPRPVADPPTPAVTLHVRVPAEVGAGKDIEYHLTVENRSQAAAHHVRVRDRLPPGTRYLRATPEPTSRAAGPPGSNGDLLWDLGTLAPGARKEIVLVVQLDAGGDLENHAYVQFEHGQVVRTRVNRPDLRLRVSAPPRVALYQPATFQLEVTNTGRAEARDVVLKDEVPQGLTATEARPALAALDNPLVWKLGNLAPGQSRRVEFSAATLQPGTYHDHATVIAAGGIRQEASAAVDVMKPRLSLAVSGPSWQVAGTSATYSLTVSNPGGVPATNVEVVDRLPPEVEVVASTEGQVKGSEVRWRLGTVAAGASRLMQMTLRVTTTGRLTNVAQVLNDNNIADRTFAATRFVDARGPATDVAGPERVEVGRRASYRVRVCNPGSAPLQSVCVSLSLADELKLVDARGQTRVHADGAVIHCDPVRTLGPGQEASWTVEVEGARAGKARLRADVTTTTPGTRPQPWEETPAVESGPAPPLAGSR